MTAAPLRGAKTAIKSNTLFARDGPTRVLDCGHVSVTDTQPMPRPAMDISAQRAMSQRVTDRLQAADKHPLALSR
jgi:hypothetical protein